MDENRFVDYFVVAGIPPFAGGTSPLADQFYPAKVDSQKAPIVDIVVINKTEGEWPPDGYECIELTPYGLPANLNHGSLRAPQMHICILRGHDQPPIIDLGILYEPKERAQSDVHVIRSTPYNRSANVNNSSLTNENIYINYRRADENADCNTLAVVDVCVIIASKGEKCPHAFCIIEKTLNKGLMMGSQVFLCYKKSTTNVTIGTYKAAILGRFPLRNHDGFALPEQVSLFCLPMGASVECWPAGVCHPLPVFSTFVLTSDTGLKMYGAAVIFYEDFDESLLTEEQHSLFSRVSKFMYRKALANTPSAVPTLHQNRCICFLSRWPFFDAMRGLLLYIYRISVSGPQPVPVERYIGHYLTQVPFPSPQRPRIFIQLDIKTVTLTQPEETQLPRSGASFVKLLLNLGAENSINLLLYAILEHKILIHSLRPDVLTIIAETLTAMMFPFRWLCPYIPLCPLFFSDVLESPTPYIIGMDSRYFDMCDPPSDVTLVDLDTRNITVAVERKHHSSNLFPKKPTKILRNDLEDLVNKIQSDFANLEALTAKSSMSLEEVGGHKLAYLESGIQDAFVRFMASLLKGYANYLLPITTAPSERATDVRSLFNIEGFLQSSDRSSKKFYSLLTKTQAFCHFIEERSFGSDKTGAHGVNDSGDLSFFDDCIAKVDATNSELREVEDTLLPSPRTVIVMPPEPVNLPAGTEYSFNGFDKLQPEFFLPSSDCKSPKDATGGRSRLPQHQRYLFKRTKQEIKTAQKVMLNCANDPKLWAKCIVWYIYSIWFKHLPSYLQSRKAKIYDKSTSQDRLLAALPVLTSMHTLNVPFFDEVCYRILMHQCGQYNQPALAIRAFVEMQRHGTTPNAVTYGVYNKVMLESSWPSENSRASALWAKLRNVMKAVALFRQACSTSSSEIAVSDKGDAVESKSTISSGLLDTDGCSTTASDLGYGSLKLGDTLQTLNCRPVAETIEDASDSTVCSNASLMRSQNENDHSGDTAAIQRTSIIVSDTIDAATWKQVLEYNNSHQHFDESTPLTSSRTDIEQSIESSNRVSKRSTAFEKKSLIRTPIVDNYDPLGALSGASAEGTVVQNTKPDEVKGVLFNQSELSSSQKYRSANDLIDRPEIEPTSKLSLSADQLDETDRTQSRTLPRLQQLKEDEPASQSVKPVRRKSFIGVMQLAKKAVASSYNGLRNSMKASSAEWLNAAVKPPLAVDETSSNNSLTLKSREASLSSLDRPVLVDDEYAEGNTPNPFSHFTSNLTVPTEASEPAMRLDMCTASKCSSCGILLYDDELTAGWSADDSNFNTSCIYCQSQIAADIHINIFDFRHAQKPPNQFDNQVNASQSNLSLSSQRDDAVSADCDPLLSKDVSKEASVIGASNFMNGGNQQDSITDEHPAVIRSTITVPYLSPFVLRKELELLIEQYGLDCFNSSQMVDKHSTVYWNVVWYFRRLALSSHIEGYVLTAQTTNSHCASPPCWSNATCSHIAVRTLWDSIHTYEDFGPPMYALWRLDPKLLPDASSDWPTYGRSTMQQIVSNIMCENVLVPIQKVLAERQKKCRGRQNKPIVYRSIYREILFLILVALGEDRIDINSYDKKFTEALEGLANKVAESIRPADRPPDNATVNCREVFKAELQL